jgi:RimJ/RimL family protein N-acetyltransferase
MIRGERVSLKPITEADLGFICDIESDKSIWQFDNITTDREVVKKNFIDRMKNAKFHDFIIQINDERQTPIGEVNIWSYIEERQSWEIGYAVLSDHQGKGYCTEALKLLLSFAFDELKAHKVVAMCNDENIASSKVMKKIGMTKEGTFREEYLLNGKWVNQLFFSILQSECVYCQRFEVTDFQGRKV